jgi:hypothetical protein
MRGLFFSLGSAGSSLCELLGFPRPSSPGDCPFCIARPSRSPLTEAAQLFGPDDARRPYPTVCAGHRRVPKRSRLASATADMARYGWRMGDQAVAAHANRRLEPDREEGEAASRTLRNVGLALLMGAIAVDVITTARDQWRRAAALQFKKWTDDVLPEENALLDVAVSLLHASDR